LHLSDVRIALAVSIAMTDHSNSELLFPSWKVRAHVKRHVLGPEEVADFLVKVIKVRADTIVGCEVKLIVILCVVATYRRRLVEKKSI
jgi:hypothetical protein